MKQFILKLLIGIITTVIVLAGVVLLSIFLTLLLQSGMLDWFNSELANKIFRSFFFSVFWGLIGIGVMVIGDFIYNKLFK